MQLNKLADMTSEIVSFPRGGRWSHNTDIQSYQKEEKDLFKVYNDKREEKNAKASQKGQKRPSEPVKTWAKKQKTGNVVLKTSGGHIGFLQFEEINAGMVILACVHDVDEYTIKVGLPGGLYGIVPITAISDAYKEQLETLAYASDLSCVSQNVCGLKDLFQPGMVLPCQVTNVVKTFKKEITLSINPKHVNHGISSKNLQKDIVVFGCISSCEDHGYMVDLGVKGSCTFLGNKAANTLIQVFTNGKQLSIGQSVWCRILVPETPRSSDSRTVQVTVDPKQIQKGKVESSSGLVMSNLVPGMKVMANVKEIREDGLEVSFLSYTGTIHKTHLPNNVWKYHRKDKISACILYINPTSKAISLSALHNLVEYSGVPSKNQFPGLSIGDVVDKAEVSYRVNHKGVYFKLPQNNKGFARVNELSDAHVDLMAEDFKPGTKHRVRVVSYNRLDSMVFVSLKANVMSQQFMQLSDIKPGMLVKCSVRRIYEDGVSVNVTNEIRAFIPTIHLADVPIKDPARCFTVGKNLKCRALVVTDSRLTLTHKKSLVKTKLPIITAYEDAQPNMELDGVIVKITEHGVLVLFFNNVKGWATRHNLYDEEYVSPNEMFHIGQMIRCWVIKCSPDEQKILLSLKFRAPVSKKKRVNADVFKLGEIVSCAVVKKAQLGFDVNILPSKQPGFLPKIHLDDQPDSCTTEFNKIQVGAVIDGLMLFKEENVPILTRKQSLLKSVRDGNIIQSFQDLEINQQHMAMVRNVTAYGVFIELIGGIIGLVHDKNARTVPGSDLSALYKHGQTVKVKVLTIDSEKIRFVGTFLFETETQSTTVGTSARLNVFGKTETQSTAVRTSPRLNVFGKVEKCRVVKKTDEGVEVIVISSGSSGFIPKMHLSDSEYLCMLLMNQLSEGDILDQVMFFKSKPQNIFTMKKTQLNAANNGSICKEFSSIKVDQVLAGVVKKHVQYGIFVEFAAGLCGLVPFMKISDTKRADYSNLFKAGQSVLFRATKVNDEQKEFSGSLKLRDCHSGDVHVSLDLLKQHLTDRTACFRNITSETYKKLLSHKVGSVVKIAITDITKKGVICQLDDGVPGYATNDHLRDITARVGDKLEALVLDVMLTENCVELLFDKIVVRNVKHLKDRPQTKAKVGQLIKCEVLLVRPDFVLVELKGHASGRLAYIPAKKHLNDVFGPQQFSTDELRRIVIKGEVDNIPIGVLQDWCKEKSLNKASVTPAKSKRKTKHDVDNGVDDMDEDSDTEDESDNSSDEDSSVEEDPFKCPYKVGQLVEAKITKIRKFQLDVDIKGIEGRVHVTEVTDELKDGFSPFVHYVKDSNITVKVIGTTYKKLGRYMPITRPNSKKNIPECSVKPSKLVKKKKGRRGKNSEEKQEYNVGDSVIAFVKEFSHHNLWMMVSPTVSGRVYEVNISEDLSVLHEPERHFKPGQGYNATIVGIEKEDQLELSLTGHEETLVEKCVTRGRILKVKDCYLIIQLAFGYKGSVNITDALDSFKSSPFSHYKPGDFVKCCVLNIDPDCKTKCVLSLRESRISSSKSEVKDPEVTDKSELREDQVMKGFITACQANRVLIQLGRDVEAHADNNHLPGHATKAKQDFLFPGKLVSLKILSLKDDDAIEVSLTESDISTPVKRKSELRKDRKVHKKQKTSLDSDSGVDLKIESDSDSETQVLPKLSEIVKAPRLSVSSSFCWDEEFSMPTSAADHTERSDEESDDEHQTPGRRKKLKHLSQKEEEEMILAYEKRQLEGDLAPQTADDFDRLILQSPDSSLVWLRYMAFHLETTEIEKARNIAERALKTISFREEQEKMNVWVAYLNLENLYGSPESLRKVFDRAIQYNEPIKVYQQLVSVYVNSGKLEEAEQLYNTMVRRFSLYKNVWLGFCLFFFKNSRLDSARKLLQRSLKSLDKKEHVEMISKFAQMEFKHGEAERGHTMFESILSNYPKRTDLWSVFIDMVVKTGDISAARQLFERVVNLKFSARKMKFFFKKYVEFEKKHGDNTTVEQVKQKALAYVETQG